MAGARKSYILRLWREVATHPWRGTLENPLTGERHGFASLTELVHFLEEQTGETLTGSPSKGVLVEPDETRVER